MSELYMIVLQGKEELGNDPEAIRLWAELSGVDIDSIDENTPFDIDVADRLLRTLPEVMERMREKARRDVESLEERLKKVLESKQERTEAEELLHKLDQELSEPTPVPETGEKESLEDVEIPPTIFAEEATKEEEELKPETLPFEEPVEETTPEVESTEKVKEEVEVRAKYEIVEEPVDVKVPGLVRLFRIEKDRVVVLKGDWPNEYDPLLGTMASNAVLKLALTLKGGRTLYGERRNDHYVVGEFEEQNLGIASVLFRKVVRLL